MPPGARLGLLVVAGPLDRATERFRALGAPNLAAAATLSTRGDLREAAARLFAALRKFDVESGVDLIVAEPPADTRGLAHAIRDRLTRAASRAD